MFIPKSLPLMDYPRAYKGMPLLYLLNLLSVLTVNLVRWAAKGLLCLPKLLFTVSSEWPGRQLPSLSSRPNSCRLTGNDSDRPLCLWSRVYFGTPALRAKAYTTSHTAAFLLSLWGMHCNFLYCASSSQVSYDFQEDLSVSDSWYECLEV